MNDSVFHIPIMKGNAAFNMAFDFMLLDELSDKSWIRHYGWERESYTYGYSQKFSEVLLEVENEEGDLCRRPTGGGVVCHVNDWTYSLMISAKAIAYKIPSKDLYNRIHLLIARTFESFNLKTELKPCETEKIEKKSGASVCFRSPVPFDVILSSSKLKVAGAAIKRNRKGILLQGSISKDILNEGDWKLFEERFFKTMADDLGLELTESPLLDVSNPSFDGIVARFLSDAWNRKIA